MFLIIIFGYLINDVYFCSVLMKLQVFLAYFLKYAYILHEYVVNVNYLSISTIKS